MRQKYYFDNAATTKTRKEVLREMKKHFGKYYGNPSSTHNHGFRARGTVELSREKIAAILKCQARQIIFTGSGSEANNLAIHQALMTKKGNCSIITSRIEHSSIFETLQKHRRQGMQVDWVKIDRNGHYDLQNLEQKLKSGPCFLSLSYVNNEIGTIQNVTEIIRLGRQNNALIHIDAVQALPCLNVSLDELDADFVSFSGHKIYAPKGIGILYMKEPTSLYPMISGGGQENNIRSGTENVPYIAGICKAIELNVKEKEVYARQQSEYSQFLYSEMLSNVDDILPTGSKTHRIPNIVSFAVKDLDAKILVKKMAAHGFDISSGSACSSSTEISSRVLDEIEIPEEFTNGGIRISTGRYNSWKQVKKIALIMPQIIRQLRTEERRPSLTMSTISQSEFRTLLSGNHQVQIVDVRPLQFKKLQNINALEIPIWKLEKMYKRLNRTQQTVVVCNHGTNSGPTAQSFLIKKGFVNVSVLNGGYKTFLRGFNHT